MNANAIKELVKVVRLDWMVMVNPFQWFQDSLGKWSCGEANLYEAQCDALRNAISENQGQSTNVISEWLLKDLAIAYDAWLDLWPDSWDEAAGGGGQGDKFPAVLDDFVPFAEDVVKLLAIGKFTTALEISNFIRSLSRIRLLETGGGFTGALEIVRREGGNLSPKHTLMHFHSFVKDLKAEHEHVLDDLENLEAKERP